MIEKGNIRRALLNHSPYLLNAMRKINRVKLEGDSAKPIDLSGYLELCLKLATLTEQERKAVQFVFDELNKEIKK